MSTNKIFHIISIIVANLIPIYGVIFLDWSVLYILLFFWAQGMLYGFVDILKISVASGTPSRNLNFDQKKFSKANIIADYFYHYYLIAMIPYGIFIYLMFGQSSKFLPYVHDNIILNRFLLSLLPFFLSLILAFYFEFIYNKEYRRVLPQNIKMSLASFMVLIVLGFGFIFIPIVLKYTHLPVIALSVIIFIKLILELFINKNNNGTENAIDRPQDI